MGRSFTSPKYRAWLKAAQASLTLQWAGSPPLEYALVGFEFHGHGRSDVDNLQGAVLDAAVKAGVLVDDRCSRIPGGVQWWQPAPTDQQVSFLYLRPWWPPSKK
jgi:Holliday junction resolvase RusA-like endonuclease